MDLLIFLFVAQGIVFGGFSAYVASQKGRNRDSWFILGFLFGFVALLALIAVPAVGDLAEASRLPIDGQARIPIGGQARVWWKPQSVPSCPICLMEQPSISRLRTHILENHVLGTRCPVCGHDLNTEQGLQGHMDFNHGLRTSG